MKTIVIYQSSTGFTKQYAEWIAEELDGKAVAMKEAARENLESYDQVIFGGWIMGNMIMGLDKLKKMYAGDMIMFAVGASPCSKEIEDAIINQNKLENKSFFYFQGGFHFDKIGFLKRKMLNMVKKSVEKKEDKTPQDEFMATVLGTSFDASKREAIVPLVELAK